MSDYFPTVRRGLSDAVERCAHMPWYRRVAHTRRVRLMAVVMATVVVATPAVGAVTNWFGLGAPNHFPAQSATQGAGRALPGTSELLGLRIPDSQGGPAWGLRLVHTTRAETCIQLGRVEDARLGSLGIDRAWDNDHLFHPFPTTSEGDACGTTDAVGDGFVNVEETGVVANANPDVGRGSAARSCRVLAARFGNEPVCPANAGRIVFMGLLGPDAESVTYTAPNHTLKTESTSGPQGAYLLVFPLTRNTCDLYTKGPGGGFGPCGGTVSYDGTSPGAIGAIKTVTYQDGHTCSLTPPAALNAAFKAFRQRVLAKLGRPTRTGNRPGVISPNWLARYRRLLNGFLKREHLTQTQFRDEIGLDPSCPAIGLVSFKEPTITRAQVATAVRVQKFGTARYGCPNSLHLPDPCDGLSPGSGALMVPIEWSFTAREAVTSSRSSYEWSVTPPSYRGCAGGSSFSTYSNIRQGQKLQYSSFFPASCRGRYTITVGFISGTPPGQADNSGVLPGTDGSIIIGQASFTIK